MNNNSTNLKLFSLMLNNNLHNQEPDRMQSVAKIWQKHVSENNKTLLNCSF